MACLLLVVTATTCCPSWASFKCWVLTQEAKERNPCKPLFRVEQRWLSLLYRLYIH